MIAAQSTSKIPPIGVVTGLNDGIVPYQHTSFLLSAMASKGLGVDNIYTEKEHDNTHEQGPHKHFFDFLETNGIL